MMRSFAPALALRFVIVLLAAVLTAAPAHAKTRSAELIEDRLALVIGNAAYHPFNPLDNPVNDARLIASTLEKAGFKVSRHENLDRNGMIRAFREFGERLNERTIAVMYYSGHALQLRDHNYLVPVDAEIRSEDEIPVFAVDTAFILGRMSHARSRINIVILDACRDNPFAGKTRAAQGLAQMDAPVGTLLAFATAPGKVAEDGTGAQNSPYAEQLARHVGTPGLPVESMFKRVREAVLKGTNGQQVPWESSSLLGEFAFVPGVASTASVDADQEAAGELAFWKSIEGSSRADEYRAYLRQYPRGRFTELAQARIAAFVRDAGAAAPAPRASGRSDPLAVALAASGGRPELLPQAGDTWRYRIQDQFRIGDLYLTATVAEVTVDGIAETWTTTSDAKVRTTVVPVQPGFYSLPGWSLTPPEFSPYLLASGPLRAGQKFVDQRRSFERMDIPLKASVEGEEDLVVTAGRFRAIKMVLRGQTKARGAGRTGLVVTEHAVWYAPEVKRFVKYTVSTRIGASVQEQTLFELMEYRLN